MAKLSKKMKEEPTVYLDYYEKALQTCQSEYLHIPKYKITYGCLKLLKERTKTRKSLAQYFPTFSGDNTSTSTSCTISFNTQSQNAQEMTLTSDFQIENIHMEDILGSNENINYTNEITYYEPDDEERAKLIEFLEEELSKIYNNSFEKDKKVLYHKSIFRYCESLHQKELNCMNHIVLFFELENIVPDRPNKPRKYLFKDEGPAVSYLDRIGFDLGSKMDHYTVKYFTFLYQVVENSKNLTLLRTLYQRIYHNIETGNPSKYPLEMFEKIFVSLLEKCVSSPFENSSNENTDLEILYSSYILYLSTKEKDSDLMKTRSKLLETCYEKYSSSSNETNNSSPLNIEQIKEDCKKILAKKSKALAFKISSLNVSSLNSFVSSQKKSNKNEENNKRKTTETSSNENKSKQNTKNTEKKIANKKTKKTSEKQEEEVNFETDFNDLGLSIIDNNDPMIPSGFLSDVPLSLDSPGNSINTSSSNLNTKNSPNAKNKRKRSPKAPKGTNEKEYVVPKEVDEDNIVFPLPLSNTLVVENLGHIPDDPENFHKPSYIYPVGYKSYKVFKSYVNPKTKTKYHSSIHSVDNHPKFKLVVEDDPGTVYYGDSPSNVWSAAFSKFEKKTSCSGKNYFFQTFFIFIFVYLFFFYQ